MSDLSAMQRLAWPLLLAFAVILCSSAPAAARVSASDAAATHAYLEARLALQRAPGVTESAELQAIEALKAQVKAECADVLASAPPHVKGEKTNRSENEISNELLFTAFGAAEHIQHPSYERFAKTVRRLRWSNPRLTRLLRSLALEQAEQSAIPTPNLCADLKSWVANRFTTVPAGTKTFLHRHSVVSSITQIEPEADEPLGDVFNLNALVAHRLKPYENHADQQLAQKAVPPEGKITSPALEVLFEAVVKVFTALGDTTPLPT
jgi:hypothetical protein